MNSITVNDLVHWMTLIMAWLVALPAGLVLLDLALPAPHRPVPDYDSRPTRADITGSLLNRPGLERPRRPDIEVDTAARLRRVHRASEAQTRRDEGLRRQLGALLAAADEVRQQLHARDDARRPVVLDEQPTGGER